MALCNKGKTCDDTYCAGKPSASCVFKYCYASYRNTTLAPCQPYFYDPATGDLVDCTPTDTVTTIGE